MKEPTCTYEKMGKRLDALEKRLLALERAKKKTNGNVSVGAAVFDYYAKVYKWKWKEEPMRNAKINSLCKQIAVAMSHDEACKVIRYYFLSEDSWYVRNRHSLTLLVSQLEKIRTEALSSEKVTRASAIQNERASGNALAIQEHLERKGT